jgi:hypothetical protein
MAETIGSAEGLLTRERNAWDNRPSQRFAPVDRVNKNSAHICEERKREPFQQSFREVTLRAA